MRVHHRARRFLSPRDTNNVHNYDNRLVNKLKFRNVKFNKDHTEVHVKLHRASDFNADVQNYIKSKANENGAQLRLITKEKIPSVANSATILDGNKFKTITKRKLDTANKRVDVIDGGQFKTITERVNIQQLLYSYPLRMQFVFLQSLLLKICVAKKSPLT